MRNKSLLLLITCSLLPASAFAEGSAKLGNSAIDEALSEANSLGSTNTGMSFEESAEALRQICKTHPRDPRCYEYTRGGRNREGQLTELCKDNPFHKRCEQYKTKSFEYMERISRICAADQKARRCTRMRKHLEDRPVLVH